MELMEDGGAAAGSSWMASKKTQAAHFKLEGRRVDCVRAGPEYSRRRARAGWGQGAATTRMAAGWEPGRPKGGRGPPAAARHAQHFKFNSGREVAREPGCGGAGRPELLGACEGGRSWTHYLGWECRRLGKPARQQKVLDRSRTHFLRLN